MFMFTFFILFSNSEHERLTCSAGAPRQLMTQIRFKQRASSSREDRVTVTQYFGDCGTSQPRGRNSGTQEGCNNRIMLTANVVSPEQKSKSECRLLQPNSLENNIRINNNLYEKANHNRDEASKSVAAPAATTTTSRVATATSSPANQTSPMQRIEEATGRLLNHILTKVREPQEEQASPSETTSLLRRSCSQLDRCHSMRANDNSKSNIPGTNLLLCSRGDGGKPALGQFASFRLTRPGGRTAASGFRNKRHGSLSSHDDLFGANKWVGNMTASIKRSINNNLTNAGQPAKQSVWNVTTKSNLSTTRRASTVLFVPRVCSANLSSCSNTTNNKTSKESGMTSRMTKKFGFNGRATPSTLMSNVCMKTITRLRVGGAASEKVAPPNSQLIDRKYRNGTITSDLMSQLKTSSSPSSSARPAAGAFNLGKSRLRTKSTGRSQMNNWLSATTKRTSLSIIQLFMLGILLFIGLAAAAPATLVDRQPSRPQMDGQNDRGVEMLTPYENSQRNLIYMDGDDVNGYDDYDDGQQDQELILSWPVKFGIDKRRLNRDRALEPAPWLREQPMRRASQPAAPESPPPLQPPTISDVSDGNSLQLNSDNNNQAGDDNSEAKSRNGRDLAADEIYLEIFRQLINKLMDGQTMITREDDSQTSYPTSSQLSASKQAAQSRGSLKQEPTAELGLLLEQTQQADEIAGLQDQQSNLGDGPNELSQLSPATILSQLNGGATIDEKTSIDNADDDQQQSQIIGSIESGANNNDPDVEFISPPQQQGRVASMDGRMRLAQLINEPVSEMPSGSPLLATQNGAPAFFTVEEIDRDSGTPSDLETRLAILQQQQQQHQQQHQSAVASSVPSEGTPMKARAQKRAVVESIMQLSDDDLAKLLYLSLQNYTKSVAAPGSNGSVGETKLEKEQSSSKQVEQQPTTSLLERFLKNAKSWVHFPGASRALRQKQNSTSKQQQLQDPGKMAPKAKNNDINKESLELEPAKDKIKLVSTINAGPVQAGLANLVFGQQQSGWSGADSALANAIDDANSSENEANNGEQNADERLEQFVFGSDRPTSKPLAHLPQQQQRQEQISAPALTSTAAQVQLRARPMSGQGQAYMNRYALQRLINAPGLEDRIPLVGAAAGAASAGTDQLESPSLSVAEKRLLLQLFESDGGYDDQDSTRVVNEQLSWLIHLLRLQAYRARMREQSQLSGSAARLSSESISASSWHERAAKTQHGGLGYVQVGVFVAIILLNLALIKFVVRKFMRTGRRRNAALSSNSSNAPYNPVDDDDFSESDIKSSSFASKFARTSSRKLANLWNKRPQHGSNVCSYSSFFSQAGNAERNLQSSCKKVPAKEIECNQESLSLVDDTVSTTGYAEEVNNHKQPMLLDRTADISMTSSESPDYNQQRAASARSLTNLANRLGAMLQNHSWSRESSLIVRRADGKRATTDWDPNNNIVESLQDLDCEPTKTGNEPDQEKQSVNLDGGDNDSLSSQCRSSRSYIKSLVDVLSSARNQLPSHQTFMLKRSSSSKLSPKAGRHDDDDDEDEDYADNSDETQLMKDAGSNQEHQQQGDTVMAQMDISAAHLILSYMEKHMDDKERLKREWDELSATSMSFESNRSKGDPDCRGSSSSSNNNNNNNNGNNNKSKFIRLLLEKRAQVALSRENKQKNRTLRIVPFDKNRVKLTCFEPKQVHGAAAGKSSTSSDYINASFIYDDNPRRPTHIITQGPLESTVAQFWQMVWEQGISVIVMLTRLNENSVKMCHSYWPTDSALGPHLPAEAAQATAQSQQQVPAMSDSRRASVTNVFTGAAAKNHNQPIVSNGNVASNIIQFELPSGLNGKGSQNGVKFEVHLVSEHVSASDYLVRNMYIINRKTGETRTITQFHYLAWPDNGVPSNVKSFLQFRRKVNKSYRDPKSPILVHCGDGAGRSGTYTLIDIILERIKNGTKEIDPRATLEHLREQRIGLCATQKQFEFVMVALAQEIQLIIDSLPK